MFLQVRLSTLQKSPLESRRDGWNSCAGFQPSLAGLVISLLIHPRLTSWAKFNRPLRRAQGRLFRTQPRLDPMQRMQNHPGFRLGKCFIRRARLQPCRKGIR
jgi:hypothetical protein